MSNIILCVGKASNIFANVHFECIFIIVNEPNFSIVLSHPSAQSTNSRQISFAFNWHHW